MAPTPDKEAPEPVPLLLEDAGGPGGPTLDLGHDLTLAQPAAPLSVPGPLSSSRWPGLKDAIQACQAAATRYPPIPDSQYLYLHDLGHFFKSEVLVDGTTKVSGTAWAGEVYATMAAEAAMGRWTGFGPDHIAQDGTIRWTALGVDPEDVAGWEAIRAAGVPHVWLRGEEQQQRMDTLSQAVERHRGAIGVLRRNLGLEEGGGNPTVPGRTWLVQWPVVEAAGEDGTRMRNEAALVVAAPGAILMQGSSVLLCTARDLGSEDADIYPTQLSSFSLRLNETQRLAWGASMHRCGRVYWTVSDEAEANKSKKPRKGKRPKPEPPE